MPVSPRFPFPLVVADVGGTNARFQMHPAPDAPPGRVHRRETAGHDSFVAAIRSVDWPEPPRSLIVCAAGPLAGKTIALTNARWSFDGDAIAAALGLEQGLLLNDFEALALAAPVLPPEWSRPVGPQPAADPAGVRLVVGAGTGLGVGWVAPVAGRWRAFPSEGGHTDLAPVGAQEEAIWRCVERVEGRVTPEALLSGPGLPRLHRAREAAAGRPAPPISTIELTARAEAEPDGPQADTLRHAWRLLGRVVGDYALTCLPKGGVLLAGGVLPKIAGFLDEAQVRAAFDAKPPVAAALRDAPIRLLIHDDAALAGMAALARRPDDYDVDWLARLWR
jgi:glucokinase